MFHKTLFSSSCIKRKIQNPIQPTNQPTMLKLLQENAHLMDKQLFFDEAPHEYYIDGDKNNVISTTTFIHTYFPSFDPIKVSERIVTSKNYMYGKYAGMTPEEIRKQWENTAFQASNAGTITHRRIELFYNDVREVYIHNETGQQYEVDELTVTDIVTNKHLYTTKLLPRDTYEKLPNGSIINKRTQQPDRDTEFNYFLRFYFDHKHLTPYRTEWEVFDPELRIAGSIDMVFRRDDGQLELGDWKRTKEITKVNDYPEDSRGYYTLEHLPASNFWQYSLQLNIYRTILEKYYGQRIAQMYLIWLNKINNSYVKFIIPRLDYEVQGIMNDRRLNKDCGKERFHELIIMKHKERKQHQPNSHQQHNRSNGRSYNRTYKSYNRQYNKSNTSYDQSDGNEQSETNDIPDECVF